MKISGYAWILGFSIAAFPGLTQAQQVAASTATADTSGGELEEVVVTARRREESAQSTPVTITTFSEENLTAKSIVTIQDLTRATPSFDYQNSPYDPFSALVGIRGQQATDNLLTQPAPIGVYIDDVYFASGSAFSLLNFDDVKQLEVLKGPQGTLYGRNTTGGAIKISTPLPDFDAISGSGKVEFGNYGEKAVSAQLNLPLIENRLALGLSARFENRGGYGEIAGIDQPLGDWQSEAFRATLRWDVNDQLQVVARGYYQHAISNGQPTNIVSVAPGATAANLATAIQSGAFTATDFGILTGALVPTPAQYGSFLSDINAGYKALSSYISSPYSQNGTAPSGALLNAFGVGNIGIRSFGGEAKLAGGSVAINYQLTPDLYVKSITASVLTERYSQQRFSTGPFLILEGVVQDQDPHQFTEELQVGGSSFNKTLEWIAGYYFFDLSGHDNSDPVLQVVPLGPTPSHEVDFVSDISGSGYAQTTYAVTSTVHFTGGIRYTDERTNSTNYTYSIIGGAPVCQTVPGAAVGPDTCVIRTPLKFTNWSYTAGPDWQVTPDLYLYAKTSRGFRAGGAGIRPPFLPFRPEQATDYEVGAKTEWLNHRLRVNVDLFWTNYDNIQRTVLTAVPGTSQVDSAVLNAANARIRGTELEILATPVRNLKLGLSGSFIDAGYIKYISPATGQDLSHNVFANVPRWQGDASVTYVSPQPWGDLSGTLDYSYKAWVNYQPDNNVILNRSSTSPYTSQGGFGLLNARISMKYNVLGDLDLAIWSRNLADKHYISYATDTTGQLGLIEVQPGVPRTFGVELAKRF